MAANKTDIKKKLHAKSERVKGVDLHTREPWVICSLFTGQVNLWNYETNQMIKSFNVGEHPVRCVKFIARKNWFICGNDDLTMRVYNYNTMEQVRVFEAHQDFIRDVAVHHMKPLVLTSSDDMTIKMWDWEKGWQNIIMFEGHVHYVMAIAFNPKDPQTFATASLDRTIKVWQFSATARQCSYQCNFTLEGHTQGVNCVEYYPGGDKPYLISGSDDNTVRIWDYQTKSCVQTLCQHTNNVSSVMFFPDRPLIITGSEDETVKVWQMSTYRLEASFDHGLQRVWCLSAKPGCNKLAIGCDKGTVVLRVGKDEPVFSMDQNGKILFSNNHEVIQMSLKGAVPADIQDGIQIALAAKDMGTCEMIPKRLEHNSTGQYVAVLSEDEYTINTTLAWRPQCFGKATDFVWGPEAKTFAILEHSNSVKVFRGFKEAAQLKDLGISVDRLFGGHLLGCRGNQSVVFYDWEHQVCVRQIDGIQPRSVSWNESGEMCALVTDNSFYILKYNKDLVQEFMEGSQDIPLDGIEDAFTLVEEVEEKVRQGSWVGDCFIFVTRAQRLNYYMGGEQLNLAVLERPMFLLGYVAKDNKVYLTDKSRNVVSYELFQSVIDFQTCVVRGDLTHAMQKHLPKVPEKHKSTIATFLDSQGFKDAALQVASEDEHRFTLAVSLHRIDVAKAVLDGQEVDPALKLKWKILGDLALQHGQFALCEEAYKKGGDHSSLLLLHSTLENKAGLEEVVELAEAANRHNVAFSAAYLAGNLKKCVQLLCDTERAAEAAVFARTYIPELVPEAVAKWRKSLGSSKFSSAIACPSEYPERFPEIASVFEKKEDAPAAVEEVADKEPEVAAAKVEEAPPAPVPPPAAVEPEEAPPAVQEEEEPVEEAVSPVAAAPASPVAEAEEEEEEASPASSEAAVVSPKAASSPPASPVEKEKSSAASSPKAASKDPFDTDDDDDAAINAAPSPPPKSNVADDIDALFD